MENPAQQAAAQSTASETAEISFGDAFDDLAKDDPRQELPATDDAEERNAAVAAADEPAPAFAAEAAVKTDPWASASPEQIAERDALAAQAQTAEHRARSSDGRVSALQKKINQLEDMVRGQQPGALVVAPPEGWDEFNKEYPDVATPMGKVLTAAEARIYERIDQRIQQAINPLAQHVETQVATAASDAISRAEATVEAAHPKWKQTINTPEFTGWLAQQPAMVRYGIESDDPRDAIKVINDFKSATGAPKKDPVADLSQRRAARVEQAATVTGNGVAAGNSRPPIPNDFDAAWDAFDRQPAAR